MHMLIVDGKPLIAAVEPEYPPDFATLLEVIAQELSRKRRCLVNAGSVREVYCSFNAVVIFLGNVMLLYGFSFSRGKLPAVFPLKKAHYYFICERFDQNVGVVQTF